MIFTIKLFAVILLVDACLKCDDDVLLYYDFKSIAFNFWYGTTVENGEPLTFGVDWDDRVYLANKNYSFNLISSSWATENCPRPGENGLKYGIDSLIVISSSDWDSAHPSGSSLNDLVYFKHTWDNAEEEGYTLLLSEGSYYAANFQRGTGFQIKAVPTQDMKHLLRFTYYKSNGESVEGITDTITWVP